MAEKIRVLIVDDLPDTRENVRKLLQFEPDLEVIGQAGTGDEAIQMARENNPDVVLMDINMPGTDGIHASQLITQAVPRAQVIIMSVQSEADYLRRAMLAGARDFLMKPFSGDELVAAIRNVYDTRPVIHSAVAVRPGADGYQGSSESVRDGNLIAVFSPKGGIGCTTVAVNIAVALADSGYSTLLVDGSLQFGDVAVMLNLKPLSTIIDVIERIDEIDQDLVGSVAATHESGLRVLMAPPRPEMAELVTESHMKTLLTSLRQMFDFVIIDTSSNLNDVILSTLDMADRIILVAQQNLPTLKNVSRFFDLSDVLEYDRDKVMMVVNHSSNRLNISVKDISDTLKRPIVATIPRDEVANDAADQGRPLVHGSWQRSPSAVALKKLANHLAEDLGSDGPDQDHEDATSKSRWGRLFGTVKQ